MPSINKPWHLLVYSALAVNRKRAVEEHRLALGLSRNRCVYSEDFKFSEDSVRVVKQRMLLWLENGSFIRRKWICYQSVGRVNNNCTNTL